MYLRVYVSNFLGKSISIIDGQTLIEEDRICLDENVYPHHFCIDAKEENIYIPSCLNGILYIVGIKDRAIKDSVSVGGNLIQVVLRKEELFIANEDSNCIYMLNTKTLEPIGIISVDNMPHGMVLDENLCNLYVPCVNCLIVIDVISKNIVKKIKLGFEPWHLKVDEYKNIIYVVTKCGKILIISRLNFEILGILNYFKLPIEISINYLKNEIYITDFCDKSINIIDSKEYKIIEKIRICGNPLGIDISKDKKILFISDIEENKIKVIDIEKRAIFKEIKVDKEPTTIICR